MTPLSEELLPAVHKGPVVRYSSKTTLPGVLSKEYYLIKAYFPKKDSHLKLFSHYRGFDFEDGVRVLFEREGDSLRIKISVKGWPEKVLFEKENYFSNQNELDCSVEVDNGTSYGFRVQVWENFVNRTGILKDKAGLLTDENLLVDSLQENLTFYTKGQGLKWGIQLFRAQLIKGSRISPKVL